MRGQLTLGEPSPLPWGKGGERSATGEGSYPECSEQRRSNAKIIPLPFWSLRLCASAEGGNFDSDGPPGSMQQQDTGATPETTGEHLRIETEHGPLHFWIPDNYHPRSAGMVIYIHGYYTSVDQTWDDDHLEEQFQESGRNALFIAVEAPRSNFEDVAWKSLDELLRTVADRTPFPLPRGPLVVVGHSGGFRTILLWLRDPRMQYVILLDGLYAGQAEYHYWLRPHPRVPSHRMVLVASDTWRQSNQLARRTYGTARRRYIPVNASSFTSRETRARLLYLISQYNHMDMISSGKVIPVLLQITPIKALPIVAEKSRQSPPSPP